MKKLYTLSFVLLASLSFAQLVSFTGTGTLISNGWQTHSGTAGQLSILATASDSGNSLSRAGFAPSAGNRATTVAGNSEDANIALTATITSGTAYYSVLVKYMDATTLATNGDYSLCLTSVAATNTTAFQARIYAKPGTTPNTVAVGVLNNSGGTAAPSYATTEIAVNATHLLVVKYDLATNTGSLFVNPTAGAAEPAASATNATGTTAAPSQIAGFAVRQGGAVVPTATAGTGNMEFDEIRVGTTWASVTPTTLSTQSNTIVGLSIYPNPVTDGQFFVTSNGGLQKNVSVFDVLGKQVLKASITDSAINVANLKSGVYFVKVTEEGKTATRKLVINN